MSKGLGYLQRDILAFLDSPGTEVAAGVYDLRIVARYIAAEPELAEKVALPFYPSASFSAAFSRAVRSLIERGELVEARRHTLPDGRLPNQVRFVRRRSS